MLDNPLCEVAAVVQYSALTVCLGWCVCLQDWPHKWQSFIPDLVAASKTNETLCENSMHILKLLSEEIFDFSQVDLTQVCVQDCCRNVCHCASLSGSASCPHHHAGRKEAEINPLAALSLSPC